MSFRDQRRYPRALLKPALAEVISSLGGVVTWPNLETSDVLDLSYKGVAARKPGLFPVAVATNVQVELRLGADPPFPVQARVAWCNLDWVGLDFAELPPEGHASMSEFLDAKLMGAALRPVEKVFFSPGQNFSYWFQGPSGVHVFVWLNSSRLIDRVNVDFGADAVHFQRTGGERALTRLQRKALLVLSQMDKPELPMEEFVRTLVSGV